MIALLMPLAVLASGVPAPYRWPAALLATALAAGLGWRQTRQPACRIVILPGDALVTVDAVPVDDLTLHDRGWLLQLQWRCQGRRHARLFWPDTLPPEGRRELRLAVRAYCISRSRPAVAP
ncbi:hypothetical protein [Stenotrophomonas sp. PS02289]|uniref:hypothetical protein n=1 Tax=Stenotrophomonas sp. PS02289 TaxID=2991422 RepID=UPI00249BF9A2|nr:hypothetical protein [Stenotrophomonas sp. PS02289]